MSEQNLILLHGWGMNPAAFESLAQLLSPRSVLAPALPGYPGSRWRQVCEFPQQLEQMAHDLPPGRLIGWSLGGLFAIGLALRYPHKFDALTLIACNPCFVARPGWPCAVAESVFDQFGHELARDWQRTLRRFLALQMQGEAEARSLSRNLWRQIEDAGQPDSGVLQFGLDLLKNQDCRADLALIRIPIKLILGERDRLVPIELKQQITDLAPGIQVESVAGAAHAPFLSHPTQVAALL